MAAAVVRFVNGKFTSIESHFLAFKIPASSLLKWIFPRVKSGSVNAVNPKISLIATEGD